MVVFTAQYEIRTLSSNSGDALGLTYATRFLLISHSFHMIIFCCPGQSQTVHAKLCSLLHLRYLSLFLRNSGLVCITELDFKILYSGNCFRIMHLR